MTIDNLQPASPRKWHQIWWDVWKKPGTGAFLSLLEEPDHAPVRGFIWVAVASLIVTIVTGIPSYKYWQEFSVGIRNLYAFYACAVLLSPIFAILGMVLSTVIYHAIARLLGGSGTLNELIICLSSVAAPSTLIGGVIGLLSFVFASLPPALFIPWALSIILGIYAIVLYITAIKAVEKVGTGRAALIYFIPVIIAFTIILCVILALIPVSRIRV